MNLLQRIFWSLRALPASLVKRPRRFAIIAVAILAIVVYGTLRAQAFRVESTNPSTGSVATVTPFLKVTFNHQLASKGLAVTSKPSIITSSTVSDKTLDITFKGGTLSDTTTYTVTIKNIYDTAGHRISNKTFSFKPERVDAKDLPKDQQQAILQQQTDRPASPNSLTIAGIDALLERGVSVQQEVALNQAFFKFAPTARTITIDTKHIAQAPHSPTSTSTSASMTFLVTVDGDRYKASVTYGNITAVQLRLYTTTPSRLVFDSGTITSKS